MNFVRPGDPVVVGVNGVFGERMCEVACRQGAEVVRVDARLGTATRPGTPARGTPVSGDHRSRARRDLDRRTQRDRAPGSRKGNGAPAGRHGDLPRRHPGGRRRLGGGRRLQRHPEVPRRPARASPPHGLGPGRWAGWSSGRPSWYLDLNLLARYVNDSAGGGRVYHHTAPVAMVAALHAGLGALLDEGLAAAWARHAECGALLQEGLVDLGPRAAGPGRSTACPSSRRSGCPAASTRPRSAGTLLHALRH